MHKYIWSAVLIKHDYVVNNTVQHAMLAGSGYLTVAWIATAELWSPLIAVIGSKLGVSLQHAIVFQQWQCTELRGLTWLHTFV